MNQNQIEMIAQLRNSSSREPYENGLIMKKLVDLLLPRQALELAINQVILALPEFEEKHPEVIWVREWTEVAIKFEPIDVQKHSFGFYDEDLSDTGWHSYIDAIGMLNSEHGYLLSGGVDHSNEIAGMAITKIIGTRSLSYRLENYPETWQGTEAENINYEELQKNIKAYKDSPDVIKRNNELWTTIANEIERYLSELGSSDS